MSKPDSGRGEFWVLIQIIMLAVIGFAPLLRIELFGWPDTLRGVSRIIGLVIGAGGLALVTISALHLGPNLTIFPRPIANGSLTQRGIYSIVRHPMYSGVFLSALGWSLFSVNMLSLVIALALGVFFDRKAAREEIWLNEKYPEYAAYRQRVRKLIPWLY